MPDEFITKPGGANFVIIEQNALRQLRHEVAVGCDEHVVKDAAGKWILVRKDDQSIFEEDSSQPFYFALEERPAGEWLRGVYGNGHRPWWVELETAPGTE